MLPGWGSHRVGPLIGLVAGEGVGSRQGSCSCPTSHDNACHHMFQVVERVNGTVLWGNLHLLFWLSLFPVTTAWMEQMTFSRTPVIVYGVNLLLASLAYYALQSVIFHAEGGSGLRQALGRDLKGKVSPFLYLSGIALAFVTPWLGVLVFTCVAIMWLVPDRRVERYLAAPESSSA